MISEKQDHDLKFKFHTIKYNKLCTPFKMFLRDKQHEIHQKLKFENVQFLANLFLSQIGKDSVVSQNILRI